MLCYVVLCCVVLCCVVLCCVVLCCVVLCCVVLCCCLSRVSRLELSCPHLSPSLGSESSAGTDGGCCRGAGRVGEGD